MEPTEGGAGQFLVMDESSAIVNSPAALPFYSRRPLFAALSGIVGGAAAAGGIWLPLASLGGLGSVGCFDYSHPRAYACIAVASVAAIFSLARCFRMVLLAAGVLCGILAATGIDLYQSLQDALNLSTGDTAQMARQMLAHSSLQSGAYVLPLSSLCCIVAGMAGSSPARPLAAAVPTSES